MSGTQKRSEIGIRDKIVLRELVDYEYPSRTYTSKGPMEIQMAPSMSALRLLKFLMHKSIIPDTDRDPVLYLRSVIREALGHRRHGAAKYIYTVYPSPKQQKEKYHTLSQMVYSKRGNECVAIEDTFPCDAKTWLYGTSVTIDFELLAYCLDAYVTSGPMLKQVMESLVNVIKSTPGLYVNKNYIYEHNMLEAFFKYVYDWRQKGLDIVLPTSPYRRVLLQYLHDLYERGYFINELKPYLKPMYPTISGTSEANNTKYPNSHLTIFIPWFGNEDDNHVYERFGTVYEALSGYPRQQIVARTGNMGEQCMSAVVRLLPDNKNFIQCHTYVLDYVSGTPHEKLLKLLEYNEWSFDAWATDLYYIIHRIAHTTGKDKASIYMISILKKMLEKQVVIKKLCWTVYNTVEEVGTLSVTEFLNMVDKELDVYRFELSCLADIVEFPSYNDRLKRLAAAVFAKFPYIYNLVIAAGYIRNIMGIR